MLQLRPLGGKSANELEGVDWVPQETLGVTGGCRRENLQFVCPSGCRDRVLSPSTSTQQLLSATMRQTVGGECPNTLTTHQPVLLFDLGEFVLLSSDVVLQTR